MSVNLGIRTRLFLVLFTATALAVTGMYLFMRWSFDRGLLEYVNLRHQQQEDAIAQRLEAHYRDIGGWEQLRGDPRLWAGLVLGDFPSGPGARRLLRLAERHGHHQHRPLPARPPERPSPLPLRVALLSAEKRWLAGRQAAPESYRLRPLHDGARVVGYLGVLAAPNPLATHELQFSRRQGRAFLGIAVAAALVALALALPVAHLLSRRLRRLQEATRRLAAGDYGLELPALGRDELGALGRDLNDLSRALAAHEGLRRQWVADISHELRTPLAVLRGEVEALEDGVRAPTPEALASLGAEVQRLTRLVDDLNELAMSDVGALSLRKGESRPAALLAACAAGMAEDFTAAGLHLEVDMADAAGRVVLGDPDRLTQLWRNLLANSLHYTDPGGTVRVAARQEGRHLVMTVEDSPPGVPDTELPRLFERLYRVEASRSRSSGGAGLGLAIVRAIAEAHAGTVEACRSPLGGLAIRVLLPLEG